MLKSDTMDDTPTTSWLDRPLLTVFNLDREKALYALLIALAVLTRLWDLGARVMSHDETVHIQWSWYLFKGQGYSHTPLSHGPSLFHATALSYYLFGDSDASARLFAALLGIGLVALPYTLRRWLGRSGALFTSFLFLISPSLLYYSRYIRHDIPLIFFTFIAMLVLWRYLEEGQTRWLMALAAAQSLMFATMEASFIYIGIFGLFLVLLFFARLGAPRWKAPAWESWSHTLLWTAAAGLLLAALTFGLSGLLEEPPAEPAPAEALAPAPAESEQPTAAADFLGQVAMWAAIGVGLALAGYVGLLALGSPSHQRLVLTILGLVGVILAAAALLFVSLGLVDLFPFKYRDCGQAPIPGSQPGQMQCAEANCKLIDGRCQQSVPIVTGRNVTELDQTGARIAYWLSDTEIVVVVVLIAILTLLTGITTYGVLNRWMPFRAGERRELDLILFTGSFFLPFLSSFVISGLSRVAMRLFGIDAAFYSLDYTEAGLLRSAGFVFILLAVSVAVGLWWDWWRWLYAAIVFYVIFIVLFTTVFTNGVGLASGMVGSVGYWVEQQDVERGSQPFYYYSLLVPLYEYLPLIGFIAAALYILTGSLKLKSANDTPGSPPSTVSLAPARTPAPQAARRGGAGDRLPATFPLFLVFWTGMTWLAFSVAGEKMPWLTSHFAWPMALATGWVTGKWVEGVNWRVVWRRGGWVVTLAAVVGFPALWRVLSPWLGGPDVVKPFSGYNLHQLDGTLEFLSALLVLAAVGYGLYWAWGRVGAGGVGRMLGVTALGALVGLTVRTAWLFAYVNYDYATEFMVYAHSTPDVREVMEQIEDISRRTAGDLSLDIGYTADGSYPFIWYLRNYPNAVQLPNPPSRPDMEKSVIVAGDAEWAGIEPYLGDNFVCNDYNFLWWPMQDYYGLNWQRIRYALTNSQMRAAVWDIIFRRDYRRYERATGKIVRPSEWPLRDGFRFCIRRDVLARVWSEAAAPTEFTPPVSETGPEQPDYSGLERPVVADLMVSTLGDRGNWNAPHDMALDADGNLYVADTNNHRIVKLNSEGQLVDTWDSTWWRGLTSWQTGCLDAAGQPLALGIGQFCEPWGVTVGPDNRVYVADTWNHRIQIFSTDGELMNQFGAFGQSGSSVSAATGQFYGPRDVVVDHNGLIYVSDTGNKRIQVFDASGRYLRSFGGPGIIAGRLDEPVGLAIGPGERDASSLDGLLYVADTWNLRMQVLTLDGAPQREWPIQGWDSQLPTNKPYVALDSAGRVYVSDPEGARVLVFDAQGAPLAVLGGPLSGLFELPTGVLIDQQDRLWVSDAGSQRLLRFPPLTLE
jgi:uncharacterized protein (TIGR03663 family)